MGGLSIYFEEEGLATTGISLIRIHTERTRPPRALWVPFELGRPLGTPNDPAFQQRVMRAALELLNASDGPVLVDYPEDAPAAAAGAAESAMEGMACPVDFPQSPDKTAPTSQIGMALMKEIDALAPWYELAVAKRCRTTVGISGLPVNDAGMYLAGFLEDQAMRSPRDSLPAGQVLKFAYEDLKAYYTEAITIQPAFNTSKRVEDWLFNETVLGAALWRLRAICRASSDEFLQFLGRNSIVPDRQINPPN
ncbi:MAG: hypothetical protein HY322_22025 [Betaproteobacteria bacterium]|nr:hypothetical protein [Betaproteobacteria bacterium]